MIDATSRAPGTPKPLATPEPVRRAAPARADRATILDAIRAAFSTCLGVPKDRLDPNATIDRFGVDSVSALEIVEALEKDFGPLSQTILFECQTIARLADELAERIGTPPPAPAPAAVPQTAPDRGDIAIIAVAGRYPGADTIEAFAEALREGRDLVTEVPPERAGLVPRFSDRKGAPGTSHCKWGGFLADIDRFDAGFFGYSPKAADLADPQERLFLETAWHLFERAGHTRGRLKDAYDGRVGVFVGAMYQHYAGLAADPEARALLSLSSYSAIANRVSFFFNLQGPSVAVDSMCSSGLQAVHQACQSLRAGECRLAVAGGVNLSPSARKIRRPFPRGPRWIVAGQPGLCRRRRLSAGREGVGAVLLKPVADALRDGDRVLAVIKGSLANHAGHSAGYAVPNADAEIRLMEDAFAAAGVAPDTIDYVEAAATGADPRRCHRTEGTGEGLCRRQGAARLGEGQYGPRRGGLRPCPTHQGAAAVRPARAVSDAGAGTPRGGVPGNAARAAGRARSLARAGGRPGPRRAAIGSFGAGGSNVHLILEEGPAASRSRETKDPQPRRFPLSARTEEQLGEVRQRLGAFLRAADAVSLEALARTLQHGREAFAHRIEVVATDMSELAEKLENGAYRENPEALSAAGDVSARGPDARAPGLSPSPASATGLQRRETPERHSKVRQVEAVPAERSALDVILKTLSAELGLPAKQIDPDASFDALGADSMVRTRLLYAVEEATGRELSRADLAAHPSVRALASRLDGFAPAEEPAPDACPSAVRA